jgi:hypothetical protein
VAVSVTLTADATAEVVAWKLSVLAPPGMFTVAGTATEDWLLDNATFMPPAGAAAERLIVHWLGLPPVSEDGVQPSEEMVGSEPPPPPPPPDPPTVIEPEVADSATGPPDGDDPATAPSVTLNVEAVAMRLKVSEATTPLPITFVFIPSSTQMYPAGAWAQVTVLPAAVAAAPAAVVTELTSPPGYVIAHCTAASDEVTAVKVRVTLPPAGALAEESVKESWPRRSPQATSPQAAKRTMKEEVFCTD